MPTRKTQRNAHELMRDKLITAKSILQCVACAMDNENTFFQPDEPLWAMEAAGELIGEVVGEHDIDSQDAGVYVLQAKAIVDTAIVAHDSRDAHGREIELFHVLSAAAMILGNACDALVRPKNPKPRTKKPTLQLVPTTQETAT